jgi:hypothetical protein
MSWLVRCEIICDGCYAAPVMRYTEKPEEVVNNMLCDALGELEAGGGTVVLRKRGSKHYCRECSEARIRRAQS